MKDLYDQDFYAWTQTTAQLLRDKKFNAIEWDNLIEEVESLGRKEKQELVNRLGVLLGHLLKWQYQPQNRSNSWLASIKEQRRQIQRLLAQNPSLSSYMDEALLLGYEDAVDLAVKETELPYEAFPHIRPYTLEQTLNSEFFPY